MEEYNIDSFEIKKSKVTPEKKMLPFTKILLFLGLGLLITGIVSFLFLRFFLQLLMIQMLLILLL